MEYLLLVVSFILAGIVGVVIIEVIISNEVNKRIPQSAKELYDRKRAISATYRLFEIIIESLNYEEMAQKISNIIPRQLDFETGVLAIINDQKKVLERIAISETSGGVAALKTLEIPFKQISIPLSATENITIQAILENKTKTTYSLYEILRPALSKQNCDLVQKTMGTKFSIITPLHARGKVIGVFIVSMRKSENELTAYEKEMIERFTEGVGIAIDNARLVEALKKNAEELEYANKQLKQLDHLKDEFISVTSHELRTPMTAIKSYAWMVLHDRAGPIEPKAREYINRVFLSTERLINLVNDMLDVSRIESGKVQLKIISFDLVKLANEIQQEFLARAAEHQLTLEVSYESEVTQVLADREKVQQVLENLVGNAFKFTPSGGKISISIKSTDSMIQTSVSDTGKGISSEDQKRLFTKFGRLDNSLVSISEAGGTGLGLYICKQYIEMMKGKIGVESEVGKGTMVSFMLPKAG